MDGATGCRQFGSPSPVPKGEGPGAPSTWFGKIAETGGTLGVVWKDRRDRDHPPPSAWLGKIAETEATRPRSDLKIRPLIAIKLR